MKLIDRVLTGLIVMFSWGLFSQNAPITIAPEQYANAGDLVVADVRVTEFNDIGAISLTLHYDPNVLIYQSFTSTPAFPDLTLDSPEPGTLIAGGFVSGGISGISLPDSTALLSISFLFQGGSSALTWSDNGTSCEYSGPPPTYATLTDSPQSVYYQNGFVAEILYPGAAGNISSPCGGAACRGETGVLFSIDPVANATAYVWSFPPGASITGGFSTPAVTVDFGPSAAGGEISVYATNAWGTGPSSPPYVLTMMLPPVIVQQPVSPVPVLSGEGTATFEVVASGTGLNYQWQESGAGWTDLEEGGIYSGTQTPQLTLTHPGIELNGKFYRCVVTGTCPPADTTDGTAMLTVYTLSGFSPHPGVGGEPGSFTFFPNPCKESLTITFTNGTESEPVLTLYDMTGRKHYEATLIPNPAGISSHTLSITPAIPAGIYTVALKWGRDDHTPARYSKLMIIK